LFWYFVVTLVIDDANIDVKRVITGSLSVTKMDGCKLAYVLVKLVDTPRVAAGIRDDILV
jgi:hypothetical protein